MENLKEQIANEIKETIKDKVFESFNNQAKRLIMLRDRYLAWDKLHCETHNDITKSWEERKKLLEQIKEQDPRKGMLIQEQYLLRERPLKIEQVYNKKAIQFLENVGKYVSNRINEEVIKVEKLQYSFSSGSWKINDNKIFSFKTILAGGYNIQCLHVRVIYSYK